MKTVTTETAMVMVCRHCGGGPLIRRGPRRKWCRNWGQLPGGRPWRCTRPVVPMTRPEWSAFQAQRDAIYNTPCDRPGPCPIHTNGGKA